VVENLIEIERGSSRVCNLKQEVEQVGTFFEANVSLCSFGHQ
jgi:hypothetical protein